MTASQDLARPADIGKSLARKILELEARIAQLEAGILPPARVGFDPKRIEPSFGAWGNGTDGRKAVRRIRDESEKRRKRMRI